MKLRFTKMHGLGNDFVMIDAISQRVNITAERARFLADRHFGVGCDQVLVVEPPLSSDSDFRYRIFNSDGSEVENCGNGARCFAVFVRQRRLTGKSNIRVDTAAGPLLLKVLSNNEITVNMGVPQLLPERIPFAAKSQAADYELSLGDKTLRVGAVSIGNPHAVTRVDDVAQYPVTEIGPAIEAHPMFPKRVNAGFMQLVSRSEIRLRVYERGVGETLACGTGACAAAVVGAVQGVLDTEVQVHLPGGTVAVAWAGPGAPVLMTGPATTVYHGQINI